MTRIYWFTLTGILCVSACAIAPSPPQRPASAPAQSPPPPDRVEVIPPAPSSNDFWIKGYWIWEDDRQVWVPGHWEAKRAGWHWVPAHWGMPGEQWEFIAGHWEPN
jgi:WXXGXW repeat (2 copies)